MAKIINLFGAPGDGKSTTASALFALLKRRNHKVELVTEFAKELVYEGHTNVLADQLYLLAEQNRRLVRVIDHVDYVITDSPLLLCLLYARDNYLPNSFAALGKELFDQYDNVMFRIHRTIRPYQKYGRTQTEAEAAEVGVRIDAMLDKLGYPHVHQINATETAEHEIANILQQIP